MRQERGQALQAQPEKGLLPRDLAVRDPAKYRAPPITGGADATSVRPAISP